MSDPETPSSSTPGGRPAPSSGRVPSGKGESFEIDVTGSDNPAAGPPPSAGTPRIDAKPLLEMEGDVCPRCGARLAADGVFCLKCGYDLKSNVVRTPEVGVEYTPEAPKPAPEFSAPGRSDAKTLAIIGAVLTLAAMAAAAVFVKPATWRLGLMAVALTLFQTLLHTGTGIVAVAATAKLREMRVGRVDLAAARMLAIVGAFQLITHLSFPGHPLLVRGLLGVLGGLAYWALVMLLFKRPRMDALMVMVMHFILFTVVFLGTVLATMYNNALMSAAAAAGGAGG